MKILIMAGGTGGHVYPGLAVAHELRARGHEVTWLGAPDSFEARTVPAQGIPLELVQVSGLRGKGLIKLLGAPLLILRAIAQALAVLARVQPDAVLGMGGFAAGPGGVAAWLKRIPLFVHEQNATAGFTNRQLAKLSRQALQGFDGALVGGITVGNPVRAEVAALPAPAERYDARRGALKLLVVGGSQGARALNEKLPAALALLTEQERPQVRHQGGRSVDVAEAEYARHGVRAEVLPFIHDMAGAYAWADLVVCRAGASTVAELASAGVASVLVPFPYAVDDHQTANAAALVKVGAAELIQERDLSAERLADLLRTATREACLAQAEKARAAAYPRATDDIVERLLAISRLPSPVSRPGARP